MPEENKTLNTIIATGSIAQTVVGLAFPQEKVILLALQAALREAPALYLDLVALFSKGEITQEERAAFAVKAAALRNPQSFYDAAEARAK